MEKKKTRVSERADMGPTPDSLVVYYRHVRLLDSLEGAMRRGRAVAVEPSATNNDSQKEDIGQKHWE